MALYAIGTYVLVQFLESHVITPFGTAPHHTHTAGDHGRVAVNRSDSLWAVCCNSHHSARRGGQGLRGRAVCQRSAGRWMAARGYGQAASRRTSGSSHTPQTAKVVASGSGTTFVAARLEVGKFGTYAREPSRWGWLKSARASTSADSHAARQLRPGEFRSDAEFN